MAEISNLNIRIDKDLKEQAEIFFSELGLNMSSAFNIFVRQSLRQGKIPFELSLVADPFYSSTNMTTLRQSIQEANEGKFVTRTLDELQSMEEWKSALQKQGPKIHVIPLFIYSNFFKNLAGYENGILINDEHLEASVYIIKRAYIAIKTPY